MAKQICDPNLALFVSVPEHALTFQPSANAIIQSDGAVTFHEYFRFVGRFVGKAISDGQQLACYFTRSFYKHMLDVPLTLADLEAVDPSYHKNLQVPALATQLSCTQIAQCCFQMFLPVIGSHGAEQSLVNSQAISPFRMLALAIASAWSA
jgi:hypothetical protein